MVETFFLRSSFKDNKPRYADAIPSSKMQIHILRINIDLSRFVLVGREFSGPSRIYFTGRQVFTG